MLQNCTTLHNSEQQLMLFIFRTCLVQEGWCDSVGSVEEIQAKILKRQEAAAKRERAMAYALAHQVNLRFHLMEIKRAAMIFDQSFCYLYE